ncbi:hypothetical protein [Streptomyces sp. HO565]
MMRRLRRALGAASLVADGPAQALEALRRRRGGIILCSVEVPPFR